MSKLSVGDIVINANFAALVWTPPEPGDPGEIRIGPSEQYRELIEKFEACGHEPQVYGCCAKFLMEKQTLNRESIVLSILMDFHFLVTCYGFDPQYVHEQFMGIGEYTELFGKVVTSMRDSNKSIWNIKTELLKEL